MPTDHPDLAPELAVPTAPEPLANRKNLQQLIELRWLAAAGQLATILLVHFTLRIALPIQQMLTLLAVLVLFNIVSMVRSRSALEVHDGELFAGLLVDVAVLTGQLHYAGGITNPFIFVYLLQVAVASVLLRPHYIWAIVAVATLCFAALTEWHQPLPMSGLGAVSPDYVSGLLLCFVLNASLLVIFIGRIGANLRQRDASLAALRQRAAEEEHIVRMGLLASGAAHELGTPLATISVILGDWARMAPLAAEPELREEIQEMQRQIQRCKAIVGGILLSAGETRGDAPVHTTLHALLDATVDQWRRTRPAANLVYRRDGVPDVAIISDTALQQMIGNVLDNALEAAPGQPVRFTATCEHHTLTLSVRDGGPGFEPHMLERFGTPYQSSKQEPGHGLGLFLAVNVVRTLGGRIRAHNLPDGGAEVVITLPLAGLRPKDGADDPS